MWSKAELNGKESKRGGGSGVMKNKQHRRERKAITETKELGEKHQK